MSIIQPVLLLTLILALISSQTGVRGTQLVERTLPNGLYLNCNGGGLGSFCAESIQKGWDLGTLKTVALKDKPVEFLDPITKCKITIYTTNQEVKLKEVNQLKAAALQIDNFAKQSNLTIANPSTDKTGFNGAYVGRTSGQFIVMKLSFDQSISK
ncbi:hypothetical protein DFH28DRAFT_946188 [Melampsora americana]|nr:hypothetical protein DFH28DRAFT_946188 [Melampsora americana]